MTPMNRRHALQALLVAGVAAPPLGWAATQTLLKPEPAAPGDHMSGSLRRQVETLKQDVAARPTDLSNVRPRSAVLYAWMNALSLTGIYLHPDLPSVITGVNAPGFPTTGERARARSLAAIDQFVRTLSALEKNPRLCGEVTARTEGPWHVDSYVQFEQTYTVGEAPIRVGGGAVLPNHFYFSFAELQATDPHADNYVSCRTSNRAVRIVRETYPIAGMFSTSLGIGEMPRVFFKVAEGELRPGDTVTVTYGDRSRGSKGLQLFQVSNTAVRFPFWILTEADGLLLTPREVSQPLLGGPAGGVHGFAPSIVGVDEPFEVSIRTEDRFRNLATGGAPAWIVKLDGREFRRIPASAQAITVLKDVRIGAPGVHRFEIVSEDGRFVGEANPVLVEAKPTTRIYWGETHGHCGFSEGMGTVDGYFQFARDESRLDFVSLTEHDLWMDAHEWEQIREGARKYDQPGRFITYMGYEWTVLAAYGGHHNVIFRGLDKVEPVPSQLYPALPDLYRGLRKHYAPKDVLVIPHAHMTADASQNDAGLEPVVEIVSEHGAFEWLGRRYLANGFQLGFVGAGDDHLGHPGYKMRPLGRFYFDGTGGVAAVMAPRKDRDILFDAIKQRRTYATTSDRIILKATLDGHEMGAVTPAGARRSIDGVVHGTAPIQSITLVKNGKDHEVRAFDTPAGAADGTFVEVEFWSTSEPARLLEPSRAGRAWTGTIRVAGARIEAAYSPQVEALNYLTEWVRPQPGAADTVTFRLATRGFAKAVRLKLAGPATGAKVEVTLNQGGATILQETLETPAAAAEPRRLAVKPALNASGTTSASSASDDRITVRQITPAVERDRTFSFADAEAPKDGDSYYVRVVQADGATAWSSPWWVGRAARRR
ncbi:MAG: DUF3604 domain-containing protein [Phenylobacterium sp.]|uniref:DUF3604 domain-containing protein n=1 Tax=Phenylobacterium sp. TaxID=1871053 RepID=UPI001A5128EE|nr:DUF3604 domain-containing protein [Phenylobacterium sp.]MBL8769930.1 DUF3604 domain-containing protein [Phenylobacterium sp.]